MENWSVGSRSGQARVLSPEVYVAARLPRTKAWKDR